MVLQGAQGTGPEAARHAGVGAGTGAACGMPHAPSAQPCTAQRPGHPLARRLWRVVRAENGQPRLAKIPEDAPPLNRRGAEWWPPGWGPDAAAAGDGAAPKNGAAAPGSAAAAVAAAPGDGVAARAATAQAGGQAAAAAGRRRVVCSQRDVFELLGLPWREPYQRDIP